MTMTLGSYGSLPNPVSERRVPWEKGNHWRTCNGVETTHIVAWGYRWNIVWEGTTAAMADVKSAIEAAIPATKSYISWRGGTTYTVRVDAGSYVVEELGETGGAGDRVSVTLIEVTA